MQEGRHQFGKWSEDEISAANSALDSLRAFRNRLAQELSQTAEFFEPNHRIDVDSRKTKPRKLKFFNQTASLHSWIFRHEIRLKNLSVIDSYLLGVDQSTPFVTYMMARYELELVATLNYLGAELKKRYL